MMTIKCGALRLGLMSCFALIYAFAGTGVAFNCVLENSIYTCAGGDLNLSGTFITDSINSSDINVRGFIDILENNSDIGQPSENVLRIFAENVQGLIRLGVKFPDGTKTAISRDNIIIVRNAQGSGINKSHAVYASGSVGNIPEVRLAMADSADTTPAIGVVFDDVIAGGGYGRVLLLGKISNIDTANFAEGDVAYLSATVAGNLTKEEPAHPNLKQKIGIVIVSGSTNGSILIEPASIRGDLEGTRRQTWKVGDETQTPQSIEFKGSFIGNLTANVTALRTWVLPDASGTILLSGINLPASNITNGTFAAGNYVFPNNLTVAGNLTAENITVSTGINCLSIVGGTDPDFCSDEAGGGGGVMTLLGETTLGSAASSITVTLSAAREHVNCYLEDKGTTSAGFRQVRFNGDLGAASYQWNELYIIGTAVGDTQDSSDDSIQLTGTTADTDPTSVKVQITNFADTNKSVIYDSVTIEPAGTNADRHMGVGAWYNTAGQITSVGFSTSAGNFNAGSHAWCEGKDVA